MSEHSKVIEEYLLTVYKISRSGEDAKAVTLAKRLETSAPTVHATISRMQRDGLVDVKKSKVVTLTKRVRKSLKILLTVIICLNIFSAIPLASLGTKCISMHIF